MSAKLASLFSLDQTVLGQGNESFQYTAPKQPKKGQATAGQSAQKSAAAPAPPAVLLACVVYAYRYANGQYLKQGKLGAAVLGNHATREYKILLYASQQKQVAASRIHSGFNFMVQPNNYSSFYDDQRQNWSIMFESEKAAMDFGKQVCLAKYNSAPSLDSVLIQELVPGDGQVVETGDSLEVAYSGWLYQNNSLGQMFDSNVNKDKLLRLKLGSSKHIKGWEEGMMGMKKGGKRLIIIPPAFAYGAQGVANRIPPDSTLIFEVEVKRVKFAKESMSDKQSISSNDSAAPSPVPSVEGLSVELGMTAPNTVPPKPGEPVVRAKSNSLSDQFVNPDATKAKLISRMAKMGQPMLPFITGPLSAQPDSSDSEIEDPTASRGAAHPVAPPPVHPQPQSVQMMPPHMTTQAPQQPVSLHTPSSSALLPVSTAAIQSQAGLPENVHSFQPYTTMQYSYPQGSAVATQLQPVGPMFPAQPPQYQVSSDITSFLMTEARQHNTEIRMSVSKVTDKIDQLASKVDELQKMNSGNSMLLPGISSVTMETAMIMHNIQRIIQENERLKQEVFEKSSRIEDQNEKISELIQRNQRYVEQSNLLMEQRNDSLKMTTEHTQSRVLQAEQEKVKVAEQLTAATSQVSRLQLELTAHQQKEVELRKQLTAALQEAERHGAQLNTLQSQLAELQETSQRAQSQYKAEKQTRKQLEGKVSTQEEELADIRAEKENLEKNLAERKKKSALERQRMEEEMEEVRKSYQEELENLRQMLKRSRASTDQAATEQLSIVQAELESQWQAKCDRMLASVKEQYARQQQEVCEQRDTLQQKVTQMEEKLSALKHLLESKETTLSTFQDQAEQLETLKEKYVVVQSRAAAMKEHYEGRIQQLQERVAAGGSGTQPSDTIEEVKKIMNGVFQSLRTEFNLEESYSGRVVLEVIMATIKTVTLKLLNGQQKPEAGRSDSEGEDDDEEEEPAQEVKDKTKETQQEVMPKGRVAEEEKETLVPAQLQTKPAETEAQSQPECVVAPEVQSSSPDQRQSAEPFTSGGESEAQEMPASASPESAVETIPDFEEQRESGALKILPHEVPDFSSLNNEGLGEGSEQEGRSEVGDQEEVVKMTAAPSVLSECAETVKPESLLTGGSADSQTARVSDVDMRPRGIHGQAASELLNGNQEEGRKAPSKNEPKPPLLETDPLKEILEAPEGQPSKKHNAVLDTNGLSMAEQDSNQGCAPSKPKTEQKSISSKSQSSLFDDGDEEESLFKSGTPKALKSVTTPKLEEDEDEEEVCLKGRPPPAPLFGDEDDDDLDWLG